MKIHELSLVHKNQNFVLLFQYHTDLQKDIIPAKHQPV